MSREYGLDEQRDLFDLRLTGTYNLLGREHDALFGYNWSEGTVEDYSLYDYANGFPPIGDFSQWEGVTAVRPVFTDGLTGSDWTDKQSAFFAATRFHITDALSLIGGARVVDWESEGESYGNSNDTKESGRVLPYAGLVYRIGDNYSVYVSSTETFMPQDDRTEELTHIDPTEGFNEEVGVKGEFFDGKLVASLGLLPDRTEECGRVCWRG